MTLEELREFNKRQHQRLANLDTSETKEQRTLFRTIKLMEELGELCEEVLGFSVVQRQGKNRPQNNEALAEELADVFITAFMLAENLEIDPFSAIENKIKKLNERYGK
jgi:NTP pyrophosphatase (non-canonical NTP hydrolase)